MFIHRMSATFGRLQGHTLELQDGLNILQAPNEAGKSTWCAFLISMLYGINSRERDKANFIADKNRYAPWSGAAMSGRMDCRVQNQELTLIRNTRRQTSPMGDFQAVYAGTNDAVSGLSGPICGETLLGVSREVFERSAFIRQSGLSISQDAGLERRIASLITSGEEDTSYSEAADTLKKQLNRRRHNKTGQLPALEAELREIEGQIAEAEQLALQLSEARVQADSLTGREAALAAELAYHDQWEAAQQQEAIREVESAAVLAEQRAASLRQRMEEERIPENDTIGRLRGAIVNLETVRRSVDKARAERDEAMKVLLRAEAAVNESPFAGQTPESARREAAATDDREPAKWNPVPGTLTILVGVPLSFAAFYAALLLTSSKPLAVLTLAVCLVAVFAFAQFLKKRAFQKSRAELRAKRFGTTDPAAISELADTYIKLCEARNIAQADANAKSAALDTLYNSLSSNEQGILLEVRRFAPAAYDIPTADSLLRSCAVRRRELAEAESAARESRMRWDLQKQQFPAASESHSFPLSPPPRSRAAVAADLETTRRQLAAAISAADRLTGQLHAMGDPVVLRSAAAHLSVQISDLEAEYEAIQLAMGALDNANTTLQNRFSPALGRRAAEIFGELTEGRYSGVVLDRAFRLAAEPVGDSVYREAALLSAGAADQLYLATRLAICELVLPEDKAVPIVLDDALANFDDTRCAAALRWLKEAAKKRQILLFTCHSREGDFFSGDSEVSIQRLTDVV